MNLSAIFITRPVTTILLMLGILVFGTLAYQQLPVSDLPTIDFPTIQVSASLPGASPDTVASSIALPLEKQFATIAGLQSINSTSAQGSTNITLNSRAEHRAPRRTCNPTSPRPPACYRRECQRRLRTRK
jgi:HAE1 family hydrophobic/amphiphilic exporter-1